MFIEPTSSRGSEEDFDCDEKKSRKKRRLKDLSFPLPSSRLNKTHTALPSVYEKFLRQMAVTWNSQLTHNLEGLKRHYLEDCQISLRNYHREHFNKPAPFNPAGIEDHVVFKGAEEYYKALAAYFEACPDYCVKFFDVCEQVVENKTILLAKFKAMGTLISKVPVAKSDQLGGVIDSLSRRVVEEQETGAIDPAHLLALNALIVQADLLQRSSSSPSSPSDLRSASSAECEEVELKLVALPMRVRGWYVMHFQDHDVRKIGRVEAHYYHPADE